MKSEDWIVRYYAGHDMVPDGHKDGELVGKLVHCKDCRFFEKDHFEKVPWSLLPIPCNICTKWGDGCKTNPEGYCFLGERVCPLEVERG